MFIVLLKFSDNKNQASELIEEHKAWIKRGIYDGVFILVGSLQPNMGGGIIAHNANLSEIQDRINEDPFVAKNVVSPEIIEITPAQADERLQFLIN